MPTWIDISYVFIVTIVLTIVETLVLFPRFKAAALANVPGVRSRGYRFTVIAQWVVAVAAVAIWVGAARPWRELGLVPPEGARIWFSVLLVSLLGGLAVHQTRAIGRLKPARRAQLRGAFTNIEYLLPHTRLEARWFAVLSLTAGVCEELIYRGFLVWVLRPFAGTAGALALGVALFALGHAYQGWRGMLKTAGAGFLMSVVVLGTGWLIPAMVLHALIDLNAGCLAFIALDERKAIGSAPA